MAQQKNRKSHHTACVNWFKGVKYMVKYKKVDINNEDEIKLLSHLASSIVKEHFDPIVGVAQNDYMIDKFQSVTAITEQLRNGYQYYLVENENAILIGFVAFYKCKEELHLSKFYLRKEERGKGIAKDMLLFIKHKAREAQISSIVLNVNRNNDAIKAYEKIGFRKIREEMNDIGNGFVMDDFVYQCQLK
jgi:GNAT superfamily N-acetyltransferase